MLDMVCVHLRIVLEHKGNCSTTWVDVQLFWFGFPRWYIMFTSPFGHV